jgi:hypothetical protein
MVPDTGHLKNVGNFSGNLRGLFIRCQRISEFVFTRLEIQINLFTIHLKERKRKRLGKKERKKERERERERERESVLVVPLVALVVS